MKIFRSSRSRSVPGALLALVTMVAALLASTSASGHTTGAAGHALAVDAATGSAHEEMAGSTSGPALTPSQSAFRDQMRKLWEDHVTWTRLAIVTFADGSGGFESTAGRLLQNQQDLGDAIKPFYGDAAGEQLSSLLTDHITIAVELLQAARDGDSAKVEDAAGRWYANSEDIADFLAAANPRYWPQSAMRAAMRAHLDQTLAEAQHELGGDYEASVADYDLIHAHILEMADVLSVGIIRSFPGEFR